MENKEKAVEEMRTLVDIKTPTGFKCQISRAAVDDWGLMQVAARAAKSQEATVEYIGYVLDHTLDSKTAERLKAHCTDSGRVSFTRLVAEIDAIFTSFNSSKN